jgi:hypothetical protein
MLQPRFIQDETSNASDRASRDARVVLSIAYLFDVSKRVAPKSL